MSGNSNNNVITFPKKKVITVKEPKIEDINHNMDMMRQYHIQETILNLAPIIFNHLDIAGFGLSDEVDEDIKDGAFLIEAIRSMLCKHYDIFHPFQVVAENIFDGEPDEDSPYKIVDELKLDLRDPEETTEEE